MAYAGHSDPFLAAAFWSGSIALLLASILLLEIIWLRIRQARSNRKRQRLIADWRPLIIGRIAGSGNALPPLAANDIPLFLHLWVHYHESLRGDVHQALTQMIDEMQLRPLLRDMLQQGGTEQRLLATTALGFIKDGPAWNALVALARSPEPALSIIAARALTHIDDAAAAAILIPLLIRRRDWSLTKIALMLRESGSQFRQAFLARVARSAQKKHAYVPRLLRLVESLHLNQTPDFVAELLQQSDNPELIAACLRLVCEPQQLALVRPLLNSPHWTVRVQAATLLGRLGARADAVSLEHLLQDKEWWVRYRAAQALAAMPFISREELQIVQQAQTDPYAADMLQQVMAETAPT